MQAAACRCPWPQVEPASDTAPERGRSPRTSGAVPCLGIAPETRGARPANLDVKASRTPRRQGKDTMATEKVPLWLISTLKGGVRKSTTAMMLAFALANRGEDVLVVDADHGTQGVTDWATRVYADGGGLPVHVIQWAPSQGLLVPFVQRAIRETGARRVIVDVGGEAPEVLRQIIMIANLVVSPVGPEQGELARVSATASIVGPSGVPHVALLTRVPTPGAGIAREAREYLTGEGRQVLTTETEQNRERYAHVWGTVPADLGAYEPLTDELLKGWG